MTKKPGLIDRTLVHGDILFAAHRDRCRYIGLSTRDQLLWLESNRGKWRRIQDVQEETAPLAPRVESENNVGAAPAGPNCETSSCDIRKDDDDEDEDDVALVDTLPKDCSPPYQATSLPTPVKVNVTNRSTKAEPLPHAQAAASEAKGPQTKPGRSGGCQLKKQKPPAEISNAGRKLSPERMRIVLDSLRKYPILSDAARKAGVHRKTLEYWMKCSAAGQDQYDVEWRGETWKFHEHCEAAMHEADDKVVGALIARATGYDEIVTYRGRVIYQMDEFLLELGYQGRDAYLKDKNGNPVPQTIRKVDTKAGRWVLERLRPEVWGKNRKIDVPHQGGVLVVGATTKKLKNGSAASIRARKWKSAARMIRKTKA
jgi:hypothetical protein